MTHHSDILSMWVFFFLAFGMQVSNANNVKIYSITSSSKSAIPEWLARRNSGKLRYDAAWRNRIELIQDFEFPEASMKIRTTPDQQYIMATGVYKPQIRVSLVKLRCTTCHK
jgi:ribosome biogenesis protein ENP2